MSSLNQSGILGLSGIIQNMTPHPARVHPKNKCLLGEKESGLTYMTRSSKMVCAGSFDEGVMGRHGQGEVRATVE